MTTGPLPEMSLGRPNAPVTIVNTRRSPARTAAPSHADAFPEFKRTYIDTGKVRYILQRIPDREAVGQGDGRAPLCAPDKYFDLYGKFMAAAVLGVPGSPPSTRSSPWPSRWG